MTSTTTQRPKVDAGALAGAISNEVAERFASSLVVSFRRCEEDDRPLNDLQKIKLVEEALYVFNGFERFAAVQIVDDLTRHGISVWGLPTTLEDLLPEDGDDA
jgi:hypothetical protein